MLDKLKKKVIDGWQKLNILCMSQMSNVYAGMTTAVFLLLIMTTFMTKWLALILAPLISAFIIVSILSAKLQLCGSVKYVLIECHKFIPKDAFWSFMIGNFWVVFVVAFF